MVKADLNRALIVDRALDIADEEGLAAITIRRLAQEFGVTPMALYWHVANKDELLGAMGDWFFEEIAIPDDLQDWADELAAIVRGIIDVLRRHPASASLAAPRVLQSEAGLNLTERALGVLRGAGFDVQQSADIARTALQTAVMLVSNQPGGEHEVAAAEREAALDRKRAAIAALSRQNYPHLIESATALFECEDDVYFTFGVDLFVRGVREMHAAQSLA